MRLRRLFTPKPVYYTGVMCDTDIANPRPFTHVLWLPADLQHGHHGHTLTWREDGTEWSCSCGLEATP